MYLYYSHILYYVLGTDGEDGTGKPQINHKFTPTSWHNIKRPILLTIAISIVALLVATLTLTTVFLKGDDDYDGETKLAQNRDFIFAIIIYEWNFRSHNNYYPSEVLICEFESSSND